jgi:hypothetical protein
MRFLAASPESLQGVFRFAAVALQMQERVSLQRASAVLVCCSTTPNQSQTAQALLIQDSVLGADYAVNLKALVLAEGQITLKTLLLAIGSSAVRMQMRNEGLLMPVIAA